MVENDDDRLVTVCSACLQASCWQGIFYCDDAVESGTIEYSVGKLRKLGREHPDYWGPLDVPEPR